MHDLLKPQDRVSHINESPMPRAELQPSKPVRIQKSLSIAQAFAGAISYDEHASVQRKVAAGLAARISHLNIPTDARILEIGCGTGFLGEALIPHAPMARWTMTDLSPDMLMRAQRRLTGAANIRFSLMDGQRPDLDGPFDLICSSLAFQWFADLPLALSRLRKLLPQGGWLAFTTLTQGCFSQWRDAHQGAPCGIPDYPCADALRSMGLAVTVQDHPMQCESAAAFLRHLKGIGAHRPKAGYLPAPPAQFKRIMHRFDAEGSRVSYQVATCLMQA